MTEENKFDKYFTGENSSPDNTVREIPTISNHSYPDRVPTGYEPIGEIQLRGRAASGFASGRMPQWVLFTGWIIFAPITILLIYVAIKAIADRFFLGAIFPLVIAFIILSLLWRGTTGKLGRKKRKRRRKYH